MVKFIKLYAHVDNGGEVEMGRVGLDCLSLRLGCSQTGVMRLLLMLN